MGNEYFLAQTSGTKRQRVGRKEIREVILFYSYLPKNSSNATSSIWEFSELQRMSLYVLFTKSTFCFFFIPVSITISYISDGLKPE